MARNEQDLLWTEIVNRGIESFGPNAGSLTFSVSVRMRFPDFLQSVKLKSRVQALWVDFTRLDSGLSRGFCDYWEKGQFIEMARTSSKFDESSFEFRNWIVKSSGIGDETYVPKAITFNEKCATMKEGRSEASAETSLCLIRIAFPERDAWRLFSRIAVVTTTVPSTAVNTLYGHINVLMNVASGLFSWVILLIE
ncbi:hypothetical protein V6N13_057957 [Hibiscus sabdariffa]|uniref:FAE domain-containing protein n=1 Tax=Hibiscus sabdariffa TaxID=183260 RepID=A0ABR2GHL1_9ROSI